MRFGIGDQIARNTILPKDIGIIFSKILVFICREFGLVLLWLPCTLYTLEVRSCKKMCCQLTLQRKVAIARRLKILRMLSDLASIIIDCFTNAKVLSRVTERNIGFNLIVYLVFNYRRTQIHRQGTRYMLSFLDNWKMLSSSYKKAIRYDISIT